MPRYTQQELDRKDIVDAVRTVVRLRTRIAQRHELNEVESNILDQFDRSVAEGQAFELDVAKLVGELDETTQ